jgi:YidC/Oxa1 family membrane protein insertase
MQALSLFGGPKPSPRVNSSIADKEGEQSGVDSPIADKERKQSSSVLIYRIRDLENRAKSRGESQE